MSNYGRLNTGLQVSGSISPATETDSYRTFLIAGLTYQFDAQGRSSGNGTLTDPHMAVTTTGGTQLAYDDDVSSTNRDAQIVYTPSRSGDYLVNVAENGGNATGSYRFTISPGYASDYNDDVRASQYGDAIAGLDGNDAIAGFAGQDYLYGQNGNDSLRGGDDRDNLFGGNGNDLVRGEGGGDLINGGAGADRLAGGVGSDRFIFNLASDSAPNAFDRIIQLDDRVAFSGIGVEGGDVLDVSGIDADPSISGNQAFRFSSGPLTRGVAQLYENDEGDTIFVASTDNDTTPEILIRIEDGSIRATAYTSDEFIL